MSEKIVNPKDIIILTMGVDVVVANKDTHSHLRMGIYGYNIKCVGTRICEKKFIGDLSDIEKGAWRDLYEYMLNVGKFCDRGDGLRLNVKFAVFGSTSKNMNNLINSYIEGWQHTSLAEGAEINVSYKKKCVYLCRVALYEYLDLCVDELLKREPEYKQVINHVLILKVMSAQISDKMNIEKCDTKIDLRFAKRKELRSE